MWGVSARSRATWVFASILLTACGAQSRGKAPAADGQVVAPEAGSSTLLSAVSARFPAADAPSVCTDAPLRLGFSRPVSVGAAGKIQIFKASAPDAPVDSIDLGEAEFSNQVAGRPFRAVRPVFVEGNDVIISLHSQALTPNETYFVRIDEGVFLGENGASLGELTAPRAWRFTTGAPAPKSPSQLSVALDGSGDFCSVQGALDYVPARSVAPVTISLKNGIYREIVLISNKRGLTLRGEDRKKTVIAYANNDTLQQRAGTRFRAMVAVENVDRLTIENLTLHNLTPQQSSSVAGSQAEALRVDPGTRVILRNADFISRQDTLLLSGSVYVADSFIEGNVDFVWGKGVAYFERSELKTVARSGYLVQSRNAASQYGYVFVDSKLTADEGITGAFLARIDASEFPGSHVAFVNCQMGPHISPAGFQVTPPGTAPTPELRFWEYQSTKLDGGPVDVSSRVAQSRQLSQEEARALRDKVAVLGWDPSAP